MSGASQVIPPHVAEVETAKNLILSNVGWPWRGRPAAFVFMLVCKLGCNASELHHEVGSVSIWDPAPSQPEEGLKQPWAHVPTASAQEINGLDVVE